MLNVCLVILLDTSQNLRFLNRSNSLFRPFFFHALFYYNQNYIKTLYFNIVLFTREEIGFRRFTFFKPFCIPDVPQKNPKAITFLFIV